MNRNGCIMYLLFIYAHTFFWSVLTPPYQDLTKVNAISSSTKHILILLTKMLKMHKIWFQFGVPSWKTRSISMCRSFSLYSKWSHWQLRSSSESNSSTNTYYSKHLWNLTSPKSNPWWISNFLTAAVSQKT